MTFDYSQAGEYLSPMYQMARNIYYSRFFQRIESVFLFTWVIASVITVAAAFYIFISIYCKAFKINRHRPLLLPGAFLLFMLSILPQSLTEVLEINLVIIRQYSMFLIYAVPILALLVAVVLNKKGEKTEFEKD
jgi:tellurite resistance protein TehA-like permease